MPDWVYAVILGIIEGLTEFIPVSSTGHLILLVELIVIHQAGQTRGASSPIAGDLYGA
mgnify:CR=1 FL=1